MSRLRSLLSPLLVPRARRTVVLVAVLYVACMGWPILALQHEWLGWLPATMGSFQISAVWGSVVICATAAWLGGAPRRAGLSEWVAASSQGILGVYRQPIVLCGALGIASYTLVWAVMFVMTFMGSAAPLSSSGGSWELLLVLPIAWVSAIVWSAVGVALGRFVRFEAAIALSVIISYIGYVVPSFYLTGTPLNGIALIDHYSWLTLQPGTGELPARLFLWSAAAAVFTALALSLRRTLIAAGIAGAASMVVIVVVGSTITPIPGAADPICSGDAPQVCTVTAAATVLPEFAATVTDSLTVIPEGFRPELVRPEGSGTPDTGVVELALTYGDLAPALLLDRDVTLASLGQRLFDYCATPIITSSNVNDPLRQESLLVEASLNVWWRIEQGLSLEEPIIPSGAPWLLIPELVGAVDRGQALAGLPAEDRLAWFERNDEALRACSDQDIDWP